MFKNKQQNQKIQTGTIALLAAMATLGLNSLQSLNRIPTAVVPTNLFPSKNSETLTPRQASPRFLNWGLQNSNEGSHIHALDAWKIEEGNRSIVVAVVDTGIDANHPDLKQNLWHGPNGIYGWDFVANRANPFDDHGHGTHVAGILGAGLNAKQGISGVAHKVSIMAVKYYSVNNSDKQNLVNSIKALNWAIDNGANIINYSGGGAQYSKEEYDVLVKARSKNVIVVAAAGNERQDSDKSENFYYPCAYRLENIICVAATNINKNMLPASNWGKTKVDVAAPGENILSTVPGGRYGYMSGTSQATAFVSGLVALMLAKNSSLSPTKVREVLNVTADRLPSLKDKIASEGKVNAYAALTAVSRIERSTQNQNSVAGKNGDRSISIQRGKASVSKDLNRFSIRPASFR